MALAQEAEVPEGAGAAMQERGRVRDLLQAAQDGDMDAFKARFTCSQWLVFASI